MPKTGNFPIFPKKAGKAEEIVVQFRGICRERQAQGKS
jgi:hypothetical protein